VFVWLWIVVICEVICLDCKQCVYVVDEIDGFEYLVLCDYCVDFDV